MNDFDPRRIVEDEVDAIWVALHAVDDVLVKGKVLGLDLGTRFGFALANHLGFIEESGWYNTKRSGESEGMARLRFKRALVDMVKAMEPTLVYYEIPGAFKGHGGKVIFRQIGILEAELTEMKVPYGGVHLATLKKFATGRGNAKKDDMRAALIERFGHAED